MNVPVAQFDDYFKELWGRDPYPWQRRLAQQVCNGHWPRFIDLPTASGKTACLDIGVFALATQAAADPTERTVGRRIFFVVNRRVIVDEAHQRGFEIAEKLNHASPGTVLHAVADALRHISGNGEHPPLDVTMLRGGIVRDNRWARSITQPTLITSTIDQVGSRLLFRGYGVTPEAAPLHAALIAHDSTILLDEAHISQPFVQTLEAVRTYRGENWTDEPICTPFHFVQMTATPGDVPAKDMFRLNDEDHQILYDRHGKSKPTNLCIAKKAKGKNAISELAAELAARAVELQGEERRNVAVVVNRIATARAVYRCLLEQFKPKDSEGEPAATVDLAIGRMRPLDRDHLMDRIQGRVGKVRSDADDETKPMFVVATQCLEVGADFDFDALVSECASLDALRQRFGRLNRTGRSINSRGCIVIRADQVSTDDRLDALDAKNERDDPIYGNALSRTWNWLQGVATDNAVDFGVNAMNTMLHQVDMPRMFAPRADAPVMFPAYLDMWAQTNPTPTPSPDVTLFLHGPQRGEPDVNVCWREDLPKNVNDWLQTVSLCPPSSPECMPVPIGVVRDWLAHGSASDEDRSDLLDDQTMATDESESTLRSTALVWRGIEHSIILRRLRELRPGDTIVLPVSAEGWDVFGHVPDHSPKDLAERAYRQSRGRVILRLHPLRIAAWSDGNAVDQLKEWINDQERTLRVAEIRDLLRHAADELADEDVVEDARNLRLLASNPFEYERYPNQAGVALRGRKRVPTEQFLSILPAMDDGEDEPSKVLRDKPVPLGEHLEHVRTEVDRTLSCLPTIPCEDAIRIAANLHDLGKADERFQAMLINGDRSAAGIEPMLWAKSIKMPESGAGRSEVQHRSGLPNGFRHEILSVQLAETLTDTLPDDEDSRNLVLHLIAAHHGRGRPFAPVVIDKDPPEVALNLHGLRVKLTTDQRRARPPYRLDSGIAERFWKLTRRFGWWGLAYLEAILRLADQRASEREDSTPDETASVELQETAI